MSAFFVGTDHIDAILSWLDEPRRRTFGIPMPDGQRKQGLDTEDWTAIGRALIAENIASLRARYPSDWQEMVDVDVNAYTYEHNAHFIGYTKNLAITVIKLIDCYEYQSCEHDGWEESWAHRFCEYVVSAATSQIPGYDDAPWGYHKPAGAPQVVRLSDLCRQ